VYFDSCFLGGFAVFPMKSREFHYASFSRRNSQQRYRIANQLRQWLTRFGVKTLFIEPGSPWENG
jgi:hypothetical protein